MLTRVLALFMAMLLGVLLLAAGVFAGIWMQADFEAGSHAASVVHSLNIAVVNQDMGVLYNGEEINFADEIIDTFDDEYILASRSSAETGITNGTYAAMISFPGDFSNQLAGINAVRPERAVFRYQLSITLSQRDSIETLLKIMRLERQINEAITFMYTASAFGELHDAQTTIMELLQNGEESAASIRTFVAAELVPNLNVSDKERDIPDVDYPDFGGHMNENDTILNELSEKYREHMDSASEDYRELLADAEQVFLDSQSVNDALDAFDILHESRGGGNFDQLISEQEREYNDRNSRLQSLAGLQSEAIENAFAAIEAQSSYHMPEATSYSAHTRAMMNTCFCCGRICGPRLMKQRIYWIWRVKVY